VFRQGCIIGLRTRWAGKPHHGKESALDQALDNHQSHDDDDRCNQQYVRICLDALGSDLEHGGCLSFCKLAEEVGFEPTEPCGSTVFKTAALNHSAIPPRKLVHRTFCICHA
jgi:hypothetical protein